MPRFDGTGPFGTGPMGRGMGPCGAGRRSGFGSGFGQGFCRLGNFRSGWNRPRWGWGAWGGNQTAPQDEVQALKQEAAYLQEQMEAIQKRLNELEGA
jgi:Family of unknown function (DUF5320)